MNVFVRYRRVNDEWRDVDIRQTRVLLPPGATVEALLQELAHRWSLNAQELGVRVFDKDFGEFIDIDEDPARVTLLNVTKYEVIHRVGKPVRDRTNAPIVSQPVPPVASNSGSVSPPGSADHADEPCTSNPGSVKHEVVELESDEEPQPAPTQASSYIDEISTQALSMYASTSPVTQRTSAHTQAPAASTSYKLNVLDQLERSEYGQQCLDHFEELCVNSDLTLANPIKVKFVNIIGQWLMMNCRTPGQPTADERRSFIAHCLSQLPCELNHEIFTNKDGTGTLDNYVKNKRQSSKRRDGYLLMAKRPRLDPAASENATAAATAAVGGTEGVAVQETIDIAESLLEEMIYDMARLDSSLFKDKIIEKHKDTLRYRRRWIEELSAKQQQPKDKVPVTVLTRFPQMCRINELISIDFEHIMKTRFPNWQNQSMTTKWRDTWSKKILHYAMNNGNPFAVTALKDFGLEKLPSISDEDRCIFSLRLLPSLVQRRGTKITASDADCFIVEIKQENRCIVNAIKAVRSQMEIACPLILQLTSYRNAAGEEHFQSSYFILIEDIAIPVDGQFDRALELLIQSYYVFEIPYPGRLYGVFRLLEHFYGMQSARRTPRSMQFLETLEKCPI